MIPAWVAANLTRIIVYTGLALVVIGSIFAAGYSHGVKQLYEYQADQARASVALVVKQGAVTERVVTRFIKVQAESANVEEAVKRGVEAYAAANSGMCLDPAWRELHDRAAKNTVPDAGLPADGPKRTPAASGGVVVHGGFDSLDGHAELRRVPPDG